MEHGAEPTPDPPGEPSADAGGPDRDLATLEALERELASLEGELDRVDRAGGAPPAPDGDAAEPPS